MKVHPTAIVHPKAELEDNVEVGAYSIIGDKVKIGKGSKIYHQVCIEPYTIIGAGCQVYPGAILGCPPQHLKYKGEESYLIIGDNNIIRECVTLHRAVGSGEATQIANNNYLMAYVHLGHNCKIGSNIVLSNSVGISGYVVIEDYAVLGGMVGVHQYVRIGKLSMVGGYSKVVQDVPPFMLVDGNPAKVYGLNLVGLRRAGVPPKVRDELKQAYKYLYRSNLNLSQAIEEIETEIQTSEELEYLLQFLKAIKTGHVGRQLDKSRGY